MSEDESESTCILCQCVPETRFYSGTGQGPFCRQCWDELPNQAIAFGDQLTQLEEEINRLKTLLDEHYIEY